MLPLLLQFQLCTTLWKKGRMTTVLQSYFLDFVSSCIILKQCDVRQLVCWITYCIVYPDQDFNASPFFNCNTKWTERDERTISTTYSWSFNILFNKFLLIFIVSVPPSAMCCCAMKINDLWNSMLIEKLVDRNSRYSVSISIEQAYTVNKEGWGNKYWLAKIKRYCVRLLFSILLSQHNSSVQKCCCQDKSASI